MAQVQNRVLEKMLERLFASLVSGPSLNCRPHASRQRVDLSALSRLKDLPPGDVLRELFNEARAVKVVARVAPPPATERDGDGREQGGRDGHGGDERSHDGHSHDGHRHDGHSHDGRSRSAAEIAWLEQNALLSKLRTIAEDARTYEQDTGVHVLNIGFPLLSLPPAFVPSRRGGQAARRILAPIALIPVSMTLKHGGTPAVELACRGDGVERVTPNAALLAWLEQQTKQSFEDVFADEHGRDPWREIAELTRRVAEALEMQPPTFFDEESSPAEAVPAGSASFALAPTPRTEALEEKPAILLSAVLGLFPVARQGLIRDTQAMLEEPPGGGPVESFIRAGLELEAPSQKSAEPPMAARSRRILADERLVAPADPFQSRAVSLARQARGLVVHGPPGTGKSQTITNIIGDHLARGERVLFVCDKRTALDVVANRLEHMGLGQLCAVVHDPQRDQRELYRSVREQLEGLPDAASDAGAPSKLAKMDAELQQVHDELSAHHAALMEPPAQGQPSFHELAGAWLSTHATVAIRDESVLSGVSLEELEQHEPGLREMLQRGLAVRYASNPWVAAAGVSLADFLVRPMDLVRSAMKALLEAAGAADDTADPAIPRFSGGISMAEQGGARAALAEELASVLKQGSLSLVRRWASEPVKEIQARRQEIASQEGAIALLRQGPLDAELSLLPREQWPDLSAIGASLHALEEYLRFAKRWYGFLAFGANRSARAVVTRYGLPLNVESAQRVRDFLLRLRARHVLTRLHLLLSGQAETSQWLDDQTLDDSLRAHVALFDLLIKVETAAALTGLGARVREALLDADAARRLMEGLRKSAARAAVCERFAQALASASLFDKAWIERLRAKMLEGHPTAQEVRVLVDGVDTLESLLRVRQALATLPAALGATAEQLLAASADAESALRSVRKAVLAQEISRRLRQNPILQSADAHRIEHLFDRYRSLEAEKKDWLRKAILYRWTSLQKERLLASTGSRLSPLGADMRRRLALRGEKAMRLRQVVAMGQQIDGGDPLFDLRPIWMASPETVAQIFPRGELFATVIFDEASQCRLEEALPVLRRGKRVVIAGDPRQLPPTRFFESSVASSEEEEIESDQQLFESQQAEVEDLLAAALNLSIEQCYLDVHYRSRNADLIQFSNVHFYGSRLQPIPGHPANRSTFPPLTVHRVDGVYTERTNRAEAERVGRIVHDLLRRAEPPSIGIACFNLQQRDLIVDVLEELAESDREFAQRLANARSRRGAGSFEGLFVKNLENVQGDERDHVIISTTYGPDASGRFYRRFGPLGRAGGGRRLNVLVTRAREEVHLVTSIPRGEYMHLPPVPPDQAPGGGYLLFAYLRYAEQLAEEYAQAHAQAEREQAQSAAVTHVRSSRSPSQFAQALAQQLAAAHQTGADVHWGNEGFAIDLALHHPRRPEDVTLGVLCDGSRFAGAADPVEWDLFRVAIHESQGWKLHRLWTPHFFRDPQGSVERIVAEAAELADRMEDRHGIRVVK